MTVGKLPGKCFLSHSCRDTETLASLQKFLPTHVENGQDQRIRTRISTHTSGQATRDDTRSIPSKGLAATIWTGTGWTTLSSGSLSGSRICRRSTKSGGEP